MLIFVVTVLLGTMGLALIRAVRGPTVYDRILAANAFSTKTIVMVTTFGFMVGEPGLYPVSYTHLTLPTILRV